MHGHTNVFETPDLIVLLYRLKSTGNVDKMYAREERPITVTVVLRILTMLFFSLTVSSCVTTFFVSSLAGRDFSTIMSSKSLKSKESSTGSLSEEGFALVVSLAVSGL